MPSLAPLRARRLGALAVGLLCLATPQVAAAQWETLPDGQWRYTATYSTAGSFRCWQWMEYLPGVACSTGASSLTLEKADSAVTFTYIGFSGSQVLTQPANAVMALGEIETRFSGPEPFAFPPVLGHLTGLGWLDLTVTIPGPTGSPISRTLPYSTIPGVGGSISWRGCHIYYVSCAYGIPIEPNPAGNAQGLYLFGPGSVSMPAANGRYAITGRAAVVPEPSTWALMTTGLLLVGGVAARRRRATR